MKKLTIVFALFLTTFAALAVTPDSSFELDAATLEAEFSDLDKIESFIEKNDGVTLQELTAERADLLESVILMADTSTVFTTEEMPILGGFWWGCCLGIVGLALVYFITDNDRDEVKKALIGCVISSLVIGLGGIFNVFNIF
ncbi:MAG: hypothetical protein ACJAVP_003572 [Spirosomataceae bacterium]|jgi:hypothetical protein